MRKKTIEELQRDDKPNPLAKANLARAQAPLVEAHNAASEQIAQENEAAQASLQDAQRAG